MNFEANFETQEPHVGNPRTKTVLTCLVAIFIICGILMAIFHPEAEFTLLFGEIKYYLGLFFIALLLLFALLYYLGEHRDTKYYFTPDGKLDLSTPRYYTKLKLNKLFALITKKGNVDEFAYDGEGNVYIKFKKGEELVAPLKDLTVSYSMDKDRSSKEWYVYKMKITTPEGAEYKVKYGPEIENAEFEDIFMILSTAGTIKESKTSKAMKWVSKLADAVDGFDFSNLAGSGILAGANMGAAALGTMKAADNNVISLVKTRVYEKKKKKSWFKKAMDYFWYIVAIVYLIIVLIVNIAALPEIFGGVDNNYNEYIQELENENRFYSDEVYVPVENDGAVGGSTDLTLYGSYGEIYLRMNLTINPHSQDDYNVSGRVCYEMDEGNECNDLRGTYYENGVLILQEKGSYGDYGDSNGVFKGLLEESNGELIYTGSLYWDGDDTGEFYLRYVN